MNKLIPTVLVLLACSLALVMPAGECDAEQYLVQFHDEFHGDFYEIPLPAIAVPHIFPLN